MPMNCRFGFFGLLGVTLPIRAKKRRRKPYYAFGDINAGGKYMMEILKLFCFKV